MSTRKERRLIAAVDISTIPVSNVERIEVYRGYIPAASAAPSSAASSTS